MFFKTQSKVGTLAKISNKDGINEHNSCFENVFFKKVPLFTSLYIILYRVNNADQIAKMVKKIAKTQ